MFIIECFKVIGFTAVFVGAALVGMLFERSTYSSSIKHYKEYNERLSGQFRNPEHPFRKKRKVKNVVLYSLPVYVLLILCSSIITCIIYSVKFDIYFLLTFVITLIGIPIAIIVFGSVLAIITSIFTIILSVIPTKSDRISSKIRKKYYTEE